MITKNYANRTCYYEQKDAEYQSGLVSVIIPTYNRAECITKAIDSVLTQTYKDYEIIVVDDGSTDNTRELLEPYMNRIRYIYQKNTGCAAARNAGIRAAGGEWIAFLDSDDRWHPEKLECQKKCLECLPVKVCFTNTHFDFEGGKQFLSQEADFSVPNDNLRLINKPLDLVMTRNEFHTTLPGMLIDRKLLERIGGFDERFCWGTDTRFFLQLAVENPIAYIDRKLVIIDRTRGRERLTIGRDMNTAAGKAYRIMTVLNYAEVYFRSRNESKKVIKKVRRTFGNYISSLAVSCCLERDNSDARRFALDGIYFGRKLRIYAKCTAVLLCPWLVRWLRRST